MASALELAFTAYAELKFDEARERCEETLGIDPRNASALLLAGLIAKKQSRLDDAVALFESSLAQAASPEALGSLAETLWRLGRLDEALNCVKQFIAAEPTNADAHLLESTILYGLRRYDAALKCAQRAKAYLPESYLVEARLGCILMRLGQFEPADIHFRNAAHLMASFAHCRLINVRRDLWEKVDLDTQGKCSPDATPLREARGTTAIDAVVAVACDVHYFHKHGAKFVNSFARNAAAGKLLHIHILDPDENFTVYIDALLSKVPLADFAVTTAKTAFATSTNYAFRRTYYSCARFLDMDWLLRKYQKTILCFDVDLVFEAPIDKMIDEIAGNDIGLVQRNPPDSVWLDIYAGYVVASYTPQALRFFRGVGNFIRHFTEREELYWHLDQIALFCVHKMMERFTAPPATCWLSAAALEAVWHIGKPNDQLLREERVTQYAIEGLEYPVPILVSTPGVTRE
ncbi:MAG: tetratricopeptide repeat protein [Burkholderiales bacterium]